jgi:hypothetical protein
VESEFRSRPNATSGFVLRGPALGSYFQMIGVVNCGRDNGRAELFFWGGMSFFLSPLFGGRNESAMQNEEFET